MATGFILNEGGGHVLAENGVDAVVQEDFTSGAGSTGTLAKTNPNDTLAASGTTTPTGTLAKTNANDTLAASGTTTPTGTLAKTNGNDAPTASGTTTPTGTLAKTNANDTLAASGTATGGTVASGDDYHHVGGGRWPQGGIELSLLQQQYKEQLKKQNTPPKPLPAVGYVLHDNTADTCAASGVVDPFNLLLEDEELLLLV